MTRIPKIRNVHPLSIDYLIPLLRSTESCLPHPHALVLRPLGRTVAHEKYPTGAMATAHCVATVVCALVNVDVVTIVPVLMVWALEVMVE